MGSLGTGAREFRSPMQRQWSFVKIKMSDELFDILEGKKEFIASETRSHTLNFVTEELTDGYIVEWNAEGENFTIGVVRASIEVAEAAEEAVKEIEEEAVKKVEEEEIPPPPEGMAQEMCQTCGKLLTYIDQYKRWYCYDCKKYKEEEEEKDKEKKTPPKEEESKPKQEKKK